MRILGFSIDWPKLKQDKFTTFRFERRDKDWQVAEVVQVKLKPRSKGGGEFKGYARIEAKEPKDILKSRNCISEVEAIEDGFQNRVEMFDWLAKAHSPEQFFRPLNKLTLSWVK